MISFAKMYDHLLKPRHQEHSEPWRYGFLVAFVLLLLWAIRLSFCEVRTDHPHHDYSFFMLGLMALINHIAYHFTKTGCLSIIMKSAALILTVAAVAYVFCLRIV